MNFVRGGDCYATNGKCRLGAKGALAKNDALECELHGRFDVWVMQNDELLITDLGFPADEPKQCLAICIKPELALRIAGEKSRQLGTMVLTTQHNCLRCGVPFWISEHDGSPSPQIAKSYFCPECISRETEESFSRRIGILGYWCG